MKNIEVRHFHYVCTTLKTPIQKDCKELIDHIAFEDCQCDGLEEMNVNEATVNELLKEKAVGGGEVPLEILENLEQTLVGKEDYQLKYSFWGRDSENRAKKLLNFLKNFISSDSKLIKRSWEDWNKIWKKTFSPIVVTEDIAVLPSWYQNKKTKYKNPLYIYPGMGFGTGTHETTFMCLLALDFLLKKELKSSKKIRCLDFGCGSGILGIAAMKYASIPTDFCDIDRNALDNCLQNLNINFSNNEIENYSKSSPITLVSRERYHIKPHYELVFANILENILLEEKETIIGSLKENSYIVLSGILNDQVQNIVEKYSTHFKLIQGFSKGDWAALLMKREMNS